uniref:Uncharacterized protein n=1 Tax=Clastoptera arizonana TaxID=38151 RepID=A0A1B6D685_9HEMI
MQLGKVHGMDKSGFKHLLFLKDKNVHRSTIQAGIVRNAREEEISQMESDSNDEDNTQMQDDSASGSDAVQSLLLPDPPTTSSNAQPKKPHSIRTRVSKKKTTPREGSYEVMKL